MNFKKICNNNYIPFVLVENSTKNSHWVYLFGLAETWGEKVGLGLSETDSPAATKMDENGSLERLQEIVLAVKAW